MSKRIVVVDISTVALAEPTISGGSQIRRFHYTFVTGFSFLYGNHHPRLYTSSKFTFEEALGRHAARTLSDTLTGCFRSSSYL